MSISTDSYGFYIPPPQQQTQINSKSKTQENKLTDKNLVLASGTKKQQSGLLNEYYLIGLLVNESGEISAGYIKNSTKIKKISIATTKNLKDATQYKINKTDTEDTEDKYIYIIAVDTRVIQFPPNEYEGHHFLFVVNINIKNTKGGGSDIISFATSNSSDENADMFMDISPEFNRTYSLLENVPMRKNKTLRKQKNKKRINV